MKLERQSTFVRHKVESLPTFWPVFILLITGLQLIAMIIILITQGLAPIKAKPVRREELFPSLCDISGNASVTFYEAANLWIGPSPVRLIEVGARFTPCMRTDFGIRLRISTAAAREEPLGCCKNDNIQGTTTPSGCVTSPNCSAPAEDDFRYDFDPSPNICSESSLALPNSPLNFHPCCVSITGHCLVTSREECDARGGWFHEAADNCRQVNCLEGLCGFNGLTIGEDRGAVVLPKANQFWRWILSIFVHLGVLHMVALMPIQLYVGIKIERTIGWLRIGLIYLISGVGGNLVSPSRPPRLCSAPPHSSLSHLSPSHLLISV